MTDQDTTTKTTLPMNPQETQRIDEDTLGIGRPHLVSKSERGQGRGRDIKEPKGRKKDLENSSQTTGQKPHHREKEERNADIDEEVAYVDWF